MAAPIRTVLSGCSSPAPTLREADKRMPVLVRGLVLGAIHAGDRYGPKTLRPDGFRGERALVRITDQRAPPRLEQRVGGVDHRAVLLGGVGSEAEQAVEDEQVVATPMV